MTEQKQIKAILIDPYCVENMGDDRWVYGHKGEFISEVTLPANSLEDIYKLLSAEEHPVHTIDAVRLDRGDVIYVDDNGLWEGAHGFAVDDKVRLAGRGLIVGTDDMGNDQNPKITLEQVMQRVTFAGVVQAA